MRLFILALAVVSFSLASCEEGPSHKYKEPLFDGKNYFVDISDIKEDRPVFYEVESGHKQVRFFLILVNGAIQSYVDACRQCYPQKAGYRCENGYITCKYCNKKYYPDALKEGAGNCYPIKLLGTASGNRYIIDKEQLISAAKYF